MSDAGIKKIIVIIILHTTNNTLMQKLTLTASATSEKQYAIFEKCRQPHKSDEFKAKGIWPYFKTISESEGPEVNMEGHKVLMFGSNNYLGLTSHPHVKESAIKAIEKYGTSCSGSRLLTGTIDLHLQLEDKLAGFMGKESCLLFSTGYQTSQGVIQPLAGRGDYILSDRDNHASIVSANLMAKGAVNTNVIRFKHNDVSDLEKQLCRIPENAGKLIVTDGVFSGNGAIVDLTNMYELADYYNTPILLDDAHAFGVIGEGGRGTASHFNLQNEIPITFCTFSKTLASIGGFVVGNKSSINFLKHNSPALIFSASPSPASTASALAALEVLIATPHLVDRLQHNASYLRNNLISLGFSVPQGETAIVPIAVDEQVGLQLWQELYNRNIFVNVFVPPATPVGTCLIRNSVMATHEQKHLDYLIETYKYVGEQMGII
jgi:8-amino-7-oxononanoate synthase